MESPCPPDYVDDVQPKYNEEIQEEEDSYNSEGN